MIKLILIGLVFLATEVFIFVRSSTSRSPTNSNNYDVTSTDFLNTQTEKLCLLARLNVSIQFSYRREPQTTFTRTIFVPPDANREKSVCNYDFASTLRLDFEPISFSLNFRRNEVEETNNIGYCQGCENGNWWLNKIYVNVSDTSELMPEASPTQIVSNTSGSGVSAIAGGFITGVSLQRGYRCTDKVLEAQLNVTKALVLETNHEQANNWTVKIYFYALVIQPFLVTNDIVKDPLLCEDVTLFLVFIILVPLLYFSIFIAYYRLKERFGLPKLRKKWPIVTFNKNEGSRKLLIASSTATSNKNQETSATLNNTSTITVTCTSTEGKESEVLKTGTKC